MRTVGVVLLSDARAFDVAVIAEVFGIDRTDHGVPRFDVRWCSRGRRRTGLHPVGDMPATHGIGGLAGCDVVIAPGRHQRTDISPRVAAELREVHERGAILMSLCSGAFTLAAAGLLDGRQATTHWALLDDLARVAPRADVQRDALYTDTGDVLTSAGVVGGLDVCLHLVRREFGGDVAAALARRIVMPPVREGGQRQYAETSMPKRSTRGVASTMDWALARLGEPIGCDDLMAHAGMSGRTFHRAFTAATGMTPGKWLRGQRIRYAQRLLEATDLTVDRIAERSGLGTAANLRRGLRAELGVGPAAYRRTFRTMPSGGVPG
ncbi:GlxA family transcriptional regulator [Haloechinothrix salitolerans]|uniref:GlxA family transcriptional regulator n=1 Tax=Haloechinothrix salitolerans TaxID=926830 RepID=A0ABW2BTX5_9PSEU